MNSEDLITTAQNTWCPGCGNFTIQHSLKSVISALESEGIPRERFVLVTGIGCHAKIADYLKINSFYSLHGRSIPVATGIKLANPELIVFCCVGDGDTYAEGLDHLIFAAKRNIDISVFVHDNRVYGLTTGQYTPTSPLGFKGRSTPHGTKEPPLNPVELMLSAGASFIARTYTKHPEDLKIILKEAILHHGFSFVDILQICASFYNLTEFYNKFVYKKSPKDLENFESAFFIAHEWDYETGTDIPAGIFYKKARACFESNFNQKRPGNETRTDLIKKYLQTRS